MKKRATMIAMIRMRLNTIYFFLDFLWLLLASSKSWFAKVMLL